jgi:hypothetical protein
MTDVSEELTAFTIQMMIHCPDEGDSTILWNVQTTWWYISEDSHLYIRSRENLKSHEGQVPRRICYNVKFSDSDLS